MEVLEVVWCVLGSGPWTSACVDGGRAEECER